MKKNTNSCLKLSVNHPVLPADSSAKCPPETPSVPRLIDDDYVM